MDNERNLSGTPENEEWLDAILGIQESVQELGPDEHAVASAGLTHPDELDLERIMQETKAENWETLPETEESADAAMEMTQRFIPQEETAAPEAEELPEETPEEAKEQEVPEEAQDKKVGKTRPAWKKGYGLFGIPHILSTVVWLALIVAIGVSLGRTIWLCAADVLAFGRESQEISITITQQDTLDTVAQKLETAGLVRYPGLFKWFAELTGKGANISAGTYTMNTIYDYNALINAMSAHTGTNDTVEITFLEGLNCAQIFALLEENGVCTAEELETYAASGELDEYWFLEGVSRGHKYCLEGYLAPDTYEFYVDDEPRRVLEKFLDEFDERFDERLQLAYAELCETMNERMRKNGYSSAYIAEHQLTVHDVVILASIIEKETANNRESYRIASVFYNRIASPSFLYLNSDATILYAINYYNAGELTTDDAINASPFNTYTHEGLPAGPISNPSLNSLGAALEPEETSYYYFIFDEAAGEHRFSKTLAEHEDWAKKLGLA